MSDQHRRDALGVAGNAVVRTPHLDALARDSVRFTSAYCADPVCTPSRASLLTGLHTHHHQTWNNTTPWPFAHRTAAHYFGQAGYMTGLIGKMHFVDGQTHGFDYHLDFNDWFQSLGPKSKIYADELGRPNSGSGLPQVDDLWRDDGDPWRSARQPDGRQGSVAVGRVSQLEESDHFDSFVARESVRFLRNFGTKQPFFLISSFLKPHDPFMPASRFAPLFRPEEMILPASWGKVNFDRVPAEVRRSIERDPPTPELRDPEEAKRRIAFYYANLAQMDDALGKVTATLTQLGLDSNTIVLYTSDHGEMLGDHGMWAKFQFYEPSCGVPLLIRAPGVTPAGRTCAMPASQVQVLPTLLELCGLRAVSGLDGTSLAPQCRKPDEVRDSRVFAEFALRSPRAKYMLRRGRWKYTFWTHDMPELYDLQDDPGELNNVALEASQKARVEAMKAELFAWYRPPEINV